MNPALGGFNGNYDLDIGETAGAGEFESGGAGLKIGGARLVRNPVTLLVVVAQGRHFLNEDASGAPQKFSVTTGMSGRVYNI